MIRNDYPVFFQYYERSILKSALNWSKNELFIKLRPEFDIKKDDLLKELIENIDHYNLIIKNHPPLTEVYINEIVNQFKVYAEFMSTTSIQTVAYNLKYKEEDGIPDVLVDYFKNVLNVYLYDSHCFNALQEYKFSIASVCKYTFIKIDGNPVFAFAHSGEIIQINPILYTPFINKVKDAILAEFTQSLGKLESNASNHLFPKFTTNDRGDYVSTAPNEFEKYDTTKHKDMQRFVKLTSGGVYV